MSGTEPPLSPMLTISLHDLRLRWYQILAAVDRGDTVSITRSGVPFARLVPNEVLVDQAATLERRLEALPCLDPEIRDLSRELVNLLGLEQVAAILGTGPTAIEIAGKTGVFPPSVLPRFDAVTDLINLLRRHRSDEQLLEWLQRPRRKFGARSPLLLLQSAWEPGDPTHMRFLSLLESEIVLKDESSN